MIVISSETRRELREKFQCSESTMTNALRFESDSLLCRKIRSYALNFCKSYFLPV